MRYACIVGLMAALALGGISAVAAMPSKTMGMDRFASADLNNDQKLSQEEFQKAFPNIQSEAFSQIDTNKDSCIDAGEWQDFLSNHGAMTGEGRSPQSCPMILPPNTAK